jgi:hypothetical protein
MVPVLLMLARTKERRWERRVLMRREESGVGVRKTAETNAHRRVVARLYYCIIDKDVDSLE